MTNFTSLKTERIGGDDRVFGFGYDAFANREKALNFAEHKAIGLLRGSEIAGRAIAEHWAPGLLSFAVKEGRAPNTEEAQRIVAQVRANDVDVRDFVDQPTGNNSGRGRMSEIAQGVGDALRNLRDLMHEAAERKLRAA